MRGVVRARRTSATAETAACRHGVLMYAHADGRQVGRRSTQRSADDWYFDIDASRRRLVPVGSGLCQRQCQSKIFNVARIAELLFDEVHEGAVESQIYVDEKGMFHDVDGRRAETWLIGCQMAMSCRGAMQRLEMCVDRRL